MTIRDTDIENIKEQIKYFQISLNTAIQNERYNDVITYSESITKLSYILAIKDNFSYDKPLEEVQER